jgi:hypothetical protein
MQIAIWAGGFFLIHNIMECMKLLRQIDARSEQAERHRFRLMEIAESLESDSLGNRDEISAILKIAKIYESRFLPASRHPLE